MKKNNIRLLRTNSSHKDFIDLVQRLDAELAERDGDLHDFYHQFNSIDHLNHVIVAYNNDQAIGCGAFKPFTAVSVEIKRMYVPPQFRGEGIASTLLKSLEEWASELGNTSCVLETGKRQPEAIALYTHKGYHLTENYGQYQGIENSVCFKKQL